MSTVALTPREIPVDLFYNLSPDELDRSIADSRAALGRRLVILGHNYQQDGVYKFADFKGDSLMLSRRAAEQTDAEFIIFCGVHFMAEVADLLCRPHQTVILPDMAAGCSMADMADIESVERAWEELAGILDPDEQVTPVTYINSAADLKAFCGRHGGIVCTSSNARKILDWTFARRPKVLFFPDQHLGRNTSKRMGIPADRMILWDPAQENGGNSAEAVRNAAMILWKGFCSVHQMFAPAHVDHFRATVPGVQVIVHPECREEVVDKADLVGSTEYIIRTVTAAPPGTAWAVGTELNLVNRLKTDNPDKQVYFLCPTVCVCSTMYRIDQQHLAWALENLRDGVVVNRIRVPDEDREMAKLALDRMLEVS